MSRTITNSKKSDLKDIHLRNIDGNDWAVLNDIRIKYNITWRRAIRRLAKRPQMMNTIFSSPDEPDICQRQSISTVYSLLPMWTANIASNLPSILGHGDITRLLCANKGECPLKADIIKRIDGGEAMSDIAEEMHLDENRYKMIMEHLCNDEICKGCPDYTPKRKPALIIGAGPSLYSKKHLELIDRFEGDVFVVGRVIKDVLEYRVPEYVSSLDAEDMETDFYDYPIVKDHMDEITAIMSVNVHPTTEKIWTGKKLFFNGYIPEQSVPNITHTLHLLTRCITISCAGNVGSGCWNLALYLGYNPIVLIGMNLSFPTLKEMKDFYPDREITYKRGYNPDFKCGYYIDNVFDSYRSSTLSWLKTMRQSAGIVTYNCTEGGGLYGKGIECMRFEDYLKGQDEHSLD